MRYSNMAIGVVTLAGCISACTPVPPSVFPDLVCGFARVLVDEADIPFFERNFGTDAGAGQRACSAISILLGDDGSGQAEPIVIEEPTIQPLTLPDGTDVVVTLQPLN